MQRKLITPKQFLCLWDRKKAGKPAIIVDPLLNVFLNVRVVEQITAQIAMENVKIAGILCVPIVSSIVNNAAGIFPPNV